MIVYGLSADPPTDVGGHGSVVRALRACEGADEVRVTPVYAHAYALSRVPHKWSPSQHSSPSGQRRGHSMVTVTSDAVIASRPTSDATAVA